MTRAPVVIAATAAGLAATLGFTPHTEAPAASAVASAPASTAPASSSSAAASSASPSSSSSSSGSSSRTATGAAISTRYGPIQLKVTIAGGKITSVEALQLPSSDPKSSQISSYAEPLLRQSALSKQTGTVDAVSGATYTSDGYATALQSALDRAGFAASTSSASGSAG